MDDTSQIDTQNVLFPERGFGMKIGFGERPALLVVDLINAFTDSSRPLGSELNDQISATNALLDVAHARKVPVIFSTVVYDAMDLSDAGVWRLKQKGLSTLRTDGDGSELDHRLHLRASDSMLYKKYASCFFGTDLVPRLLSFRVDTLVLTGCTTSGCVRATAVDSCQTGFRPMVVREAVGDRSRTAHDQSLLDLHSKYADVVSLDETIDYFKKQ